MKPIILSIITLATSLQAAELNPSRIPASAKWFLHADVDAMRDSMTGKAVFWRIEKEHGAQLQAFKRMFSIHLINDLNDVSLFGDGLPEQSVALIHGTFNRGHITDVLKAAENYSESDHDGVTVMSWSDKGKTQNAAFAEDGLVVFSHQPDSLREELDLLKSPKTVEANPFFTAAGGRPLVSASARLSEIKLPDDASAITRMVRTLNVAANESDGRFKIRMSAESADGKQANRLHRILDGVVALSEVVNKDLNELDLQSEINATQNPAGVSADLSLPVPEWLGLLEKAAAKFRAGKN